MELNFEDIEMPKLNIQTARAQRIDENMGNLSIYHVYYRTYGH